VVDAHSADGTAQFLKSIEGETSERLGLNVLECGNHGWPFSANVGLRSAHGDWIALTNPDIIFTQDFLPLWNLARENKYGVFSVGLRDKNGLERANRRVTLTRLFFQSTAVGRWISKKVHLGFFDRTFLYTSQIPIFVEHPLASFMLIHRKVIDQVGFLSNRYFLYFSDSDFANRLNAAHIQIVHLGNLHFLHAGSHSSELRTRKQFDEIYLKGMIQYARDWSHVSVLYLMFLLDRIFNRTLKRGLGSRKPERDAD
jgi:GT2 family glycosyltransferase